MSKKAKIKKRKRLDSFIYLAKTLSKAMFVSEFIHDYDNQEDLQLARIAYKIVYGKIYKGK